MGFTLAANPFYRLPASPRDGRERLADLAEDATDQGRLTRQEAQALVRTLTAPRTRLEAELAWLPGLAPATAGRVAEHAIGLDLAAALDLLGPDPSVGRLNVAAHVCAAGRMEAFQGWVEVLQAGIDPARLAASIGADRRVAEFPDPPGAEVAAGLEALALRQADAVAGTLHAAPAGAEALATAIRASAPARMPPALDGVLERWDAASLGELAAVAESLDRALAALAKAPGDWSALPAIRALLRRAAAATAPRRAREAASGMDAAPARRIAAKVRETAIDLAERRRAAGTAHALTQQLLEAFPDLPEFSAWLRADLAQWTRAKAAEADAVLLQPLADALAAARQAPAETANSIVAGQLQSGGRLLAGRLHDAFVAAVGATLAGDGNAPWLMLREFAIELHNTHKRTAAALAVTQLLVAHPAPDEAVRQKLADETRLLQRLHATQTGLGLAEAGQLRQALVQLDAALQLATDAKDRATLEGMRAEIQERRKGQKVAVWICAAVAAVVLLVAIASEGPSRRSTYTALPPAQSYVAPVIPVPQPLAPPAPLPLPPPPDPPAEAMPDTIPDTGRETMPPLPRGAVLSPDQLRWCVFRDRRLEAVRSLVATQAQIARYDELMRDLENRCAASRYGDGVLERIEDEADDAAARLSEEGRALVGLPPANAPRPAPARPSGPPPGPIERGATVLSTTRDGARLQRRLRDLGFYNGTIDGAFGPQSRAALGAFQRARGLFDTGELTPMTQQELFRGTGQ